MPPVYETLVIGGGPAGCAAAITLACAGKAVCLLERKCSAHDKVCGEFISYDAAESLTGLGIDLIALGAQPIYRLGLYSGEQMFSCDLPVPAWGLSRRVLDSALLEKAKAAGVDVRVGMTVKSLHYSNCAWDLMVTEHNEAKGNRKFNSLQAHTVFLATGKHDIHDWKRMHSSAEDNGLIGLKMHFRLDQQQVEQLRGNVEIYFYDGGYAGLQLIEDGKANLCFLINRKVYKSCIGNWERILEWLCGISPILKTRLAGATAIWGKPLAISGMPYGYVHSTGATVPHLFRLGDQAAVIHSLAGDGIAIALRSALVAAQTYAAGEPSHVYNIKAQKIFKPPIKNAQLLANLLSTALGRTGLFFLARNWPKFVNGMITRFRLSGAKNIRG